VLARPGVEEDSRNLKKVVCARSRLHGSVGDAPARELRVEKLVATLRARVVTNRHGEAVRWLSKGKVAKRQRHIASGGKCEIESATRLAVALRSGDSRHPTN